MNNTLDDHKNTLPASKTIDNYPLTQERWGDLEALFGSRGAFGGCWCMWWRLSQSEFEQQKGEGNRLAMKSTVESGEVPGLLAYHENRPVGWCSIAPREAYPRLKRSRVLAPVDDELVWSIVCFYVAKKYRHQGMTVRLLQTAVEYARQQGARILEGYPNEPKKGQPDPYVYTGLVSAFKKAGFVEVLRRSEARPIMRYYLE